MKKTKLLLLLSVLCATNAFASSYQEKGVAECGPFKLMKATIQSQQPDRTVTSTEKFFVLSANQDELFVDKVAYEDLTAYQFVVDGLGVSITQSFEFDGVKGKQTFRMNGKLCKDL
jgi:hypothetical protein